MYICIDLVVYVVVVVGVVSYFCLFWGGFLFVFVCEFCGVCMFLCEVFVFEIVMFCSCVFSVIFLCFFGVCDFDCMCCYIWLRLVCLCEFECFFDLLCDCVWKMLLVLLCLVCFVVLCLCLWGVELGLGDSGVMFVILFCLVECLELC